LAAQWLKLKTRSASEMFLPANAGKRGKR